MSTNMNRFKLTFALFFMLLIASVSLASCKTPQQQNHVEMAKLIKQIEYKKYKEYALAPEKLSADERQRIKKELSEPQKIANHILKSPEFMSAGYEIGFFSRNNYPGKMFIFRSKNLNESRLIINKFAFPQSEIKQNSWQEYLDHKAKNMGHLELKGERAEIEREEYLNNEYGSVLYAKGRIINGGRTAYFMNLLYLTDEAENFARQVRYYSDFELNKHEVNSFESYVKKIVK